MERNRYESSSKVYVLVVGGEYLHDRCNDDICLVRELVDQFNHDEFNPYVKDRQEIKFAKEWISILNKKCGPGDSVKQYAYRETVTVDKIEV